MAEGPRAPIHWTLVVALALPFLVAHMFVRGLMTTADVRTFSIARMLILNLGLPLAQFAVLAWKNPPRPFAHGMWVGAFSGIAAIVAFLLWLGLESIRAGLGYLDPFALMTFAITLPITAIGATVHGTFLGATAQAWARRSHPSRPALASPPSVGPDAPRP